MTSTAYLFTQPAAFYEIRFDLFERYPLFSAARFRGCESGSRVVQKDPGHVIVSFIFGVKIVSSMIHTVGLLVGRVAQTVLIFCSMLSRGMRVAHTRVKWVPVGTLTSSTPNPSDSHTAIHPQPRGGSSSYSALASPSWSAFTLIHLKDASILLHESCEVGADQSTDLEPCRTICFVSWSLHRERSSSEA